MQATYKKHLEVTKLLLDRGSDIEAVDNVSHSTPCSRHTHCTALSLLQTGEVEAAQRALIEVKLLLDVKQHDRDRVNECLTMHRISSHSTMMLF
jgi:hypothetical protein